VRRVCGIYIRCPFRPLRVQCWKQSVKKRNAYIRTHLHGRKRACERRVNGGREFFNVGNDGYPQVASNVSQLVSKWAERLQVERTIGNTLRVVHVCAVTRDYCNFAIFQQDKSLLISQQERAALLFGTLRGWINTSLTSRLRDYPNYSSAWDLMQVRTFRLPTLFSWQIHPESLLRRELCEFRNRLDRLWRRRENIYRQINP